jgi:uncharacterized RDD family membrane protein YckC
MNENPYAAPDHGIDRHVMAERQGNQDNYTYLGFWKRVLASIVDYILVNVAFIPVLIVLFMMLGRDFNIRLIYNLTVFVFPAIIILLFWHYKKATPGKMVFNARIVDAETFGKPRFGKLVLRYIGYIPSTLVLGLGFLWVAFDKRKRGWHDLMAGTVVIVPRPHSYRRRTRTIRKPIAATATTATKPE